MLSSRGITPGFVWAAATYRYADHRLRGPLLMIVSIIDVIVYAVVLTAVVDTVFGLGGLDRFVPSLIGLISLRWSLSCAIQASRVAVLAKLLAPYHARPILATLVVAMGPGTLVFAISVLLLAVLLLASFRAPVDLFHMLGWGLFVAAIQLLWNAVLALCIIHARLRHVLLSEVPILLGFLLVLIVSPIAYQFTDIPPAASRLLGSFNPAAHLIAAYQNAFWFIQPISLQVLPVSGLFAGGLVAILGYWARGLLVDSPDGTEEARRCFAWDGRSWSPVGDIPQANLSRAFNRWYSETPWISGSNFVALLDLAPQKRREADTFVGRLSDSYDIRQIMDAPLPIVSDRNRDRVCLVAALMAWRAGKVSDENIVALPVGPESEIVLNGLLDHMDDGEVARLTDCLREFRVGQFVIVTYRNRVADALIRLAATFRANQLSRS